MSAAGVDTGPPVRWSAPPPCVPPGTLAAHVARGIEAEVLRRGWPVGASLGSEPQLRERFGVSRAVLREAVRLVEHHQVARMRRGPSGGLFVTAPDAGPATGATVIYLEYVGTTVSDLLHARSLVEPLAVALAAGRADEHGLDRARTALDAERADAPAPQACDRLHVLLAQLSGNPVLELFVDVLTRLTSRYAHEATRTGRTAGPAEALRRRGSVVAAVADGDGERAATLMREHLAAEAAWFAEHRPPGAVRPPLRPGPPEPSAAGRAKLAEVLATRIRTDIAVRGWPLGTVLGSEADLLNHYRISRAVLREAVRLLEHHAVARMRRGPGGGLVVTRPDPQASIATMALHLEYRKVTRDDLRVARDAVELGVLDLALAERARRPLDPDTVAGLRAAAAHVTDGPIGDATRADPFHTELAELAGNPVLALFLRVLTELFRAHTSAQERPPPVDEVAAEVRAVHERILQAVLDGDAAAARRRMRRHLDALSPWWD
ncbi:FadR/GntR family transcriptional regulator [Pseudonocardia humida]|uniref:FadR family transcriptional regulator n=1 Tax=Pseudonocardia humida TaxID=2800819 RepID=A0ABT0ZSF2_9PSEU|nr:FCD domain-containing protein [Pseudonocardia humida]MCO1653628.1 FadR family transcriptional regulator [Pseudonocardia humida]